MHSNVLMGDPDGNSEKIAFDLENVRKIIGRDAAKMVFDANGSGPVLDVDGHLYAVNNEVSPDRVDPYFILHESGEAFNVKAYGILFHVRPLPDERLSGVDAGGRRYICRRYAGDKRDPGKGADGSIEKIGGKISRAVDSLEELKDLKDMIRKLKKGQFFEALTMEFSGKIKEIAQELIDFRRDLQRKIEPDIVEIAARDIPEASNQLEGINQTLESCTMKIMDINDEQMELSNRQLASLKSFLSGNGNRKSVSDKSLEMIEQDMACLKMLANLSMSMMEPLSFQDLVGQRIQRIIRLVKSMETRIEDLIISFGIKIQRHKEDPMMSFEELSREVENYKSELKGPQRDGEGLDQSDIDELLATL